MTCDRGALSYSRGRSPRRELLLPARGLTAALLIVSSVIYSDMFCAFLRAATEEPGRKSIATRERPTSRVSDSRSPLADLLVHEPHGKIIECCSYSDFTESPANPQLRSSAWYHTKASRARGSFSCSDKGKIVRFEMSNPLILFKIRIGPTCLWQRVALVLIKN